MTATCPNGHSSQATDYCDLCGVRIGPAPAAALQTSILPVIEEIGTSPAVRAQPCPDCGAARSGGDRYCEGCGHDFVAPSPSERAWEVVVTTDRARWERQRAPGISFPEPAPERRFKLDGAEMRIGRLQAGGERPEIAPDDPAISRAARGTRAPDRWRLRAPRPEVDERDHAQRRSAAGVRGSRGAARRRRPDPARRLDHDHGPLGRIAVAAGCRACQKSCGLSRPWRSTVATSRPRFSFCGSSASPNWANSSRR